MIHMPRHGLLWVDAAFVLGCHRNSTERHFAPLHFFEDDQ
jgi:hypothetical protein